MRNEYYYKGYRIRLLARELDNGHWSCGWAAEEMGGSHSHGMSGHADGVIEDDAKVKALREAKARIDTAS